MNWFEAKIELDDETLTIYSKSIWLSVCSSNIENILSDKCILRSTTLIDNIPSTKSVDTANYQVVLTKSDGIGMIVIYIEGTRATEVEELVNSFLYTEQYGIHSVLSL